MYMCGDLRLPAVTEWRNGPLGLSDDDERCGRHGWRATLPAGMACGQAVHRAPLGYDNKLCRL